jgi:hypothetical protein
LAIRIEMQQPVITPEDISRFRRRADQRRIAAEVMFDESLKQQRLETALAYERMAECGERLLGLAEPC